MTLIKFLKEKLGIPLLMPLNYPSIIVIMLDVSLLMAMLRVQTESILFLQPQTKILLLLLPLNLLVFLMPLDVLQPLLVNTMKIVAISFVLVKKDPLK